MTNIILDLDTGLDDAMALAIAIMDKDINLLGISTTYGNVVTTKSCVNSRFLLDLLNQQAIPVVKGLDQALNQDSFTPEDISIKIHGKNGLANLDLNIEEYRGDDFEYFVPFYLRMIEKYSNDITIVTTGPLTNVAYMLTNYPNEMKNVTEIVSMGGAIIFPGNKNSYAEANIDQDHLAAKIVMENDIHNVIVPLDVTEKSRIFRKDLDLWNESNTELSNIYVNLVNYYMDQHPVVDQCFVHDPSAVIYCSHRDYFTTLDLNCTVLQEECPGRIVGNFDKIRDKTKTTTICLDVEAEKIRTFINSHFVEYFRTLKSSNDSKK